MHQHLTKRTEKRRFYGFDDEDERRKRKTKTKDEDERQKRTEEGKKIFSKQNRV